MAALPRLTHSSIGILRESLRSDRAALEQAFLQHGNAARLLNAHSRLIDRYLRRVWRQLAMPDRIALAAVGGYGRSKLYPRSDIDLLILLDAEPDAALQQQLQQLIVVLWDIGLEVGHSVRTVAQCMKESADITVQTNLLEARLLCGNNPLFNELCASVQQHLDLRAFYLAKLQEQQRRHARQRLLDAERRQQPTLQHGAVIGKRIDANGKQDRAGEHQRRKDRAERHEQAMQDTAAARRRRGT
ncbi:MAG: nucleotidyltransferase domain-containing protein, partial [Gallionella sp.]|nr:nucleotidyltransferase domain-containing protein [Gallionella sp.]